MPGVAIVTDTTAYLPDDLCRASEIHRVSLYVNRGPDTTRESEIGDYGAFYDELRAGDDLPTTSQPSIGDFIDVYEPLLDAGSEIVSIHISAGLSGTVESARQAVGQLEEGGVEPGRITVIDSATTCGGLGLVALAAARVAATGGSAADVHRVAQETRAGLKLWFAVDTLEFLRRGGRIGAASAWIGSTLRIKPILTVENEITPIERVRTRGRAFERMLDYARQRRESGADGWVVQHIQAEDTADRLVDACRQIMGCEPLFVSEVGPVIGTHVGPGLLGVGAVPSHLLN